MKSRDPRVDYLAGEGLRRPPPLGGCVGPKHAEPRVVYRVVQTTPRGHTPSCRGTSPEQRIATPGQPPPRTRAERPQSDVPQHASGPGRSRQSDSGPCRSHGLLRLRHPSRGDSGRPLVRVEREQGSPPSATTVARGRPQTGRAHRTEAALANALSAEAACGRTPRQEPGPHTTAQGTPPGVDPAGIEAQENRCTARAHPAPLPSQLLSR